MGDALQRIVYEATLDEAADVAWRVANRSHVFRKQLQTNVIFAGIGSGLAFFAAWMYLAGASPLNLVLASVSGVLFGIVFAAIFGRFLDKEIRKQQRRMMAEHFSGKPTLPCEMELRPDGAWARQPGMEMLFPWAHCTGVQDNADNIQMNFTSGMCVARNRHFASAADRAQFLETARRLAAKETTIPAHPTRSTGPS